MPPSLRLEVVGDGELARRIASLAAECGFKIFAATEDTPPDAVVVASRSWETDLEAARWALRRGVPHVLVVGSAGRGEALRNALADEGFSEQVPGRVECPAGLAIGAQSGAEIAVAIVARLIQLRATPM